MEDGGAEQTLRVEGKLASPWVSELVSAWNQVRQQFRDSMIVIDLSAVTVIDWIGKAALTAMVVKGVRLTAKGVYSEYVVEQLMNKARDNGAPGPGTSDRS